MEPSVGTIVDKTRERVMASSKNIHRQSQIIMLNVAYLELVTYRDCGCLHEAPFKVRTIEFAASLHGQ